MNLPQQILQKYWGYSSFREQQEEIILAVIEGKDTLALLPTGGGKSICFQIPGLMLEGVTVVISPLIALMKDQVEQLMSLGISAKAIFSGMSAREIDITFDNCIYGGVKFLYISPERLKTKLFRERVGRMHIGLVVIDEAHCISHWGYDFRPSYLEISDFLEDLPDAKRIAVTATATRYVKEDIQKKLGFRNAVIFQKSFARKNLSYSVFRLENKDHKLLEILSKVEGTSIVYVRTRRRAQDVGTFLRKRGISADHYHAGLSGEERNRKQENWIQNRIRVMVSTNAFGMGIDKPDVRTVIHMDVPDSLESYYQEAGRAGRDGKEAYAVIFFHNQDVLELRERAKSREISKKFIQQIYQSLANYFQMAIGSHGFETLSFDLSDFCRKFDLIPTEVIKALKALEESGVVQLSDTTYQPSRVHISIDKQELYKFEVANVKFEPLLKSLLRLYGGDLFTNFVNIKESDIARLMKTSISIISDQLQYLTKNGILEYHQATDSNKLTFLVPRMVTNELPINVELIKFRKEAALQKANAMISYLESATKCRTRIFQNYFDEETLENCGFCDFCIEQKRSNYMIPKDEVFATIQDGAQTMSELYARSTHRQEVIIAAVRLLIEEERVKMERNRFIIV